MRIRLLTLRYSPTLGAFDDTPLRDLLRDKELLAFREHFFAVEGIPHIACVVTWQEASVPISPPVMNPAPQRSTTPPSDSSNSNPRSDQRPIRLETERDRILFDTLRDWRTRRSNAEGVPPYVLFNNKQLYAIIAKQPENKTALGNIDGIGPAKVERYGDAVLAILHGTPLSPPSATVAPITPGAAEAPEPQAPEPRTPEVIAP